MDAGEAPPPQFEPIGLEMMELLHRRGYRRRCSSGLGGPDPGEGRRVRRGRGGDGGVGRGGRGGRGMDAVMDGG